MPRNPESMRPTALSRTQIMVEANNIVIFEGFKAMEEHRAAGNAAQYDQAQDFINGQGYETFRRNKHGKK